MQVIIRIEKIDIFTARIVQTNVSGVRQTAVFLPDVNWNLCWLAAILCGGVILLKITRTPADKRMNVLLGLASLHLILYLLALSAGSLIS